MTKEVLIASRVPPDLLAELKRVEEAEHIDRSTALRRLLYAGIREWKMQYAANRYRENTITLARAAEEAGASVREMMDYLRQKKIPSQYDFGEWEKDVANVEKRVAALRGQPKSKGS